MLHCEHFCVKCKETTSNSTNTKAKYCYCWWSNGNSYASSHKCSPWYHSYPNIDPRTRRWFFLFLLIVILKVNHYHSLSSISWSAACSGGMNTGSRLFGFGSLFTLIAAQIDFFKSLVLITLSQCYQFFGRTWLLLLTNLRKVLMWLWRYLFHTFWFWSIPRFATRLSWFWNLRLSWYITFLFAFYNWWLCLWLIFNVGFNSFWQTLVAIRFCVLIGYSILRGSIWRIPVKELVLIFLSPHGFSSLGSSAYLLNLAFLIFFKKWDTRFGDLTAI